MSCLALKLGAHEPSWWRTSKPLELGSMTARKQIKHKVENLSRMALEISCGDEIP